MRVKPAFNEYKADNERVCPICQTVIFSKNKQKIYCDNKCSAIAYHINSIKRLAKKKKIKITFGLETDSCKVEYILENQ
jgi:NAD-dependent DNA ligase